MKITKENYQKTELLVSIIEDAKTARIVWGFVLIVLACVLVIQAGYYNKAIKNNASVIQTLQESVSQISDTRITFTDISISVSYLRIIERAQGGALSGA